MKHILSFLLIASLAIFYSCSETGNNGDNTIIDVESATGSGKIRNASDFIKEIKYIPLETSPNSMIGNIRKVIVLNEKIFVSDDKNTLNIFDMEGRHLNTLNRAGRGPEEYLNLNSFDVGADGTIYISSQNQGIVFYDSHFKFIKTALPKEDRNAGFVDLMLLKEGLFSSNKYKFDFSGGNHEQNWNIYNDSLETLFSYSTSSSTETESNSGGGVAIAMRLTPYRQYLYKDLLTIHRPGNDTIFNIDYKNSYSKSARYIINTGKYHFSEEMDKPIEGAPADLEAISLDNVAETDNYLFLSFNFRGVAPEAFDKEGNYAVINGRRVDMGGNRNTDVYAVFEKRNGKLSILKQPIPQSLGLKNDINGGAMFWPKAVTDNYDLISWHNALDLVLLAEEGRIDRGVIGNLKEDDNPVIVIATM